MSIAPASIPGIPGWVVARLPARVVDHLRSPLYRNGYALVVATGATSLLGFAYWLLAARRYSPADVGRNSALLASMTFLANLAHLNLTNGLNRFVPTSGRRTARLVGWSYGVAGGLAVVAALIYVGGIETWSPDLTNLVRDNPLAVLAFVAATALWVVFQLEDSVLTGLGRADWVVTENVIFGVMKIVLLVALATALPKTGIFASWTLPLVLIVVPINVLVFRRLFPRHVADHDAVVEPIRPRELGRYLGADYFASLLWTATTSLLPLVVLAIAGAKQSAYFYLSWTIAYAIYLLSRNLGMSLVTEGARAPQRLYEFALRTLAQSGKIVVPLAVGVALLSPVILRLLGPDYVRGASILLPLLVLSAIPNVVIATFLSAARVQRRMRAVVVVTAAMAVSVMGLSIILLDRYGLTGVGVAWLVAQSVIAIVLLLTELRTTWIPRVPLHRLPHLTLALDHAARAAQPALAAAAAWELVGAPRADPDLGAVVVRSREDDRLAVLRFARTDFGARSLRRHAAALEALRAGSIPPAWRPLAPVALASGEAAADRPWLVETHIPGQDARRAASRVGSGIVAANAAASIRVLHAATATETSVDDAVLRLWVDDPITELRATAANPLRAGSDHAALDRIATQLRDELSGRVLTTCLVHGDFWLGNVLTTAEGAVSGIVDWERAGAPGVSALDVMTLILTARVHDRRREFGPVVRDLLRGDGFDAGEQRLLAGGPGAGEVPERTILLLTWLHHAASNLQKRNHYRSNPVWVTTNVHYVLEKV
ncbi:MAG TPA: phosphotransferase [Acidimicrobiia bacterium]|jgi:O-antigen/teichoic acid export membrane protein/aminoglycoside phosphotransferase (APT) family kinase protein